MGAVGRIQLASLIGMVLTANAVDAQACPDPRDVSRDELRDAMDQHGRYEIVPTTNWGRFQTEVFLRLIRAELTRDSAGGVIRIEPDAWYRAYLDVAGLTPATAHFATRRSWELGQTILLDFRRGAVVRRLRRGRQPELAANVRIFWPPGRQVPTKFSFRDTLSDPHLKVTTHQTITYRLLAIGDTVWYDDIEGVSGRPTSGFLGFLFSIIGEGALVESRMASSVDDILVVRARSKKIFPRTVTVMVHPDGRGENGILPQRPDLAALEARLREPLEIDYLPYAC